MNLKNLSKKSKKKKSKKNKIIEENKNNEKILKDPHWRAMRIAGSISGGGYNKKTKKNKSIYNNDYVIAIPSYKRAEILKKNTLNYLQNQKINKNKIYIFVANKKEYDLYKKTLPNYYKKLVIGIVGMGNIRNFITDYFPEKTKIFNMDDDIKGLIKLTKERNKKNGSKAISRPFKNNDLHKFINDGFNECKKKNLSLFGIYPAANPFFMKKRITYDLRYIIGSVWGNINDKNLKVSLDDKEDFERSIKHYKQYGGVVRFENITANTPYMTCTGGMQVLRTNKRILESAKYLANKYPDLCTYYIKKKGFAEVRLKDQEDKYRNKKNTNKLL